jgi:hypothetical protein
MTLVKAEKAMKEASPPSGELMAAIGKRTKEATETDVLLDNELLSSSKAARVRIAGGDNVTDGPSPKSRS